MKALVFEEPRHAPSASVEMPQRSPPTRCSCARETSASATRTSSSTRAATSSRSAYPIIPGHEWSGEVAEVGGGVDHTSRGRPGGRRVRRQQRRRPLRLLDQRRRRRVLRRQGVLAAPHSRGALVQRRARSSSRSPSPTTPAVAAGGIDASDEVAVIGGGPIGLLCAMAAATMGGSVTLIEPQAHRRALGLEIGARRRSTRPPGALSEQAGRRRTDEASTS